MPDTIRIETGPDRWWDIKAWMSRGDRRRIDNHVQRKALEFVKILKEADIDVAQFQQVATQPGVGGAITRVNPDEDDAMLLYCTVAWSYAESVTATAIDTKPDIETSLVLARMRETYGLSEEARKNSSGTPSPGLTATLLP